MVCYREAESLRPVSAGVFLMTSWENSVAVARRGRWLDGDVVIVTSAVAGRHGSAGRAGRRFAAGEAFLDPIREIAGSNPRLAPIAGGLGDVEAARLAVILWLEKWASWLRVARPD